MTVDYLASPAQHHHGGIQEPASPSLGPPSPALNREQIKNRSSRGWSASGGNPLAGSILLSASQTGHTIPPLSFRSKATAASGPTSTGMHLQPSTDSAISSLDAGSPFGSILSKFDNPPLDNVRKSSGSFKVLDKKAVSNSPFLTGGNTNSATNSPTATRKPFSPSAFGSSTHASSAPSSPASKHGLGLFTRSSAGIPQPASPSSHGPTTISASAFTAASRIPHKRSNSDVENQNPRAGARVPPPPFHHAAAAKHGREQHQQEVLSDDKYLAAKDARPSFDVPSPATQFNAEMEAFGGPVAVDVTYSHSSSSGSTSGSPDMELDHVRATQKQQQQHQGKRGPRPSVAALGSRGTVSSSPFLQQGLPQPQPQVQAQSSMSSLRKGMGPREPSFTDLRAQAGAEEAGYDHKDELARHEEGRLTQHALQRKASKKSVKWAEVEEVCEFDVLTEDGESRRSSAASSNANSDDYYANYVGGRYGRDSDSEEGGSETDTENLTPTLQQLDDEQRQRLEAEDEENRQYYDDYRHSSVELESAPRVDDDDEEDATVNVSHALRRDASFHSEQASFVDHGGLADDTGLDQADVFHPGDSSASSYDDEGLSPEQKEETEVQRLIDEVAAASLSARMPLPAAGDVFNEFGTRTPKSSAGSALSAVSSNQSGASTPQPLHFTSSLSRRPLPSPPVHPNMPIDFRVDGASPTRTRGASAASDGGDDNVEMSSSGGLTRADDSQFSLPDLGLSNSPLLSFDEMALARKESLKRASPKMVHAGKKASTSPSMLSQEVLMDTSASSATAPLPLERSASDRPQITMEEVRDSLRKRPNSLFANFKSSAAADTTAAGPLCSTPPSSSQASRLPTPASNSRAGPSKAISARPAPLPVKISSEQLPTLRSATPQPASPTKEPESALDRLVRETESEAGRTDGLLAAPPMGRGRSNSSSSSGSGHSFHSADSAHSEGRDALRKRDEALLAAKRKKKGLSVDLSSSSRAPSPDARPRGRRRSLSTGDADIETLQAKERADEAQRAETPTAPVTRSAQSSKARPQSAMQRLETGLETGRAEAGFGKSLGKALDSVVDYHEKGYRVREREKGALTYLGSPTGPSKISTVGDAGDVDAGGAWRKVRRPSDIHEHRTQIKEYKQTSANRARETGAIFVKIGKLMLDEKFPIPKEATYVACELNNGFQHVATGATRLAKDTAIAQEFELIAHPGLEITLTFKLRKDPKLDRHLLPQAPAPAMHVVAPPSPSKHSHTGSAGGGFRNGLRNLLSSPKKNRAPTRPGSAMEILSSSQGMQQQPSQAPLQPILDYVSSSDGQICTVTVKTDALLKQCTGKKLKIAAMCTQAASARRRLPEIAELEITLFHIPPLQGVPVNSLPQNIEECLIGLEQARRYEETVWEGTLTQQGADCSTWRRRLMRLKGSRLLAFNEITHNAHAVLYLHTALALEDPDEVLAESPVPSANSGTNADATPTTVASTPQTAAGRSTVAPSRQSGHRRALSIEDEDDPFSTRPHSFRIVFENDIAVDFFADTAEEKAKWMTHLRPIIRGSGARKESSSRRLNEPPPLWAQSLRALRKEQQQAATAQSKKTEA